MTSLIYGHLTDEELAAKIADLASKYENAQTGGVAIVVAGDGRRIEYTRSNSAGLLGLLTDASRERDRRAGVHTSGAIRVVFPYGG